MSTHGTPVQHDQGRQLPTSLHPNDAALHAIADAREAALLARTATDRLLEIARRQDTPAQLHVVTLTAAQPTKYPRGEGRSIGIYNPTAAAVYLAVGGASATAGGRSPSCPARSALVLPVHVDQIEIAAAAADLAAGDLVIYVFLFATVQPLYFGGLS